MCKSIQNTKNASNDKNGWLSYLIPFKMHPIMRFNKWEGPMCNPSKITKKGKFVDMILDKNNNFNNCF